MKLSFQTPCLLAAALAITVSGSADATLNGASAYVTIQPNATKDAFVHTISWVALDTQYGGSTFDDPLTIGVNEGNRDKISRNTQFGNTGGSAFEIHSLEDPVGQTRFEYTPVGSTFGPVEVRYNPGVGSTNSWEGGYVYLGTDGSDGAVAPLISTPKWDDVGAFTTEPNGAYGVGWEGVTGFRAENADGSGATTTDVGYYQDTDSIDGSAPLDDVGFMAIGFANGNPLEAPQTGYIQVVIPIAASASSTDDYFTDPNFFNRGATDWTSAYVEGVFTDNASVELTVTSSSSYVAKTAVSGDFDSDQDVDNSDIIFASGNFTGAAATGEFFGQYYRDGDTDGDGDVDNTDVIATAGNFTGASSSSVSAIQGNAVPDLVYDPATGNVTLSADGGVNITGFQLESAGAFIDGNYVSASGGGFGGAFEDVSDSVLADSDLTFAGLATIDLGDVFATGLDLADLEALLTTADFGAGLGNSGQFEFVVVPEPTSLALLGLGGLLLARRRRG